MNESNARAAIAAAAVNIATLCNPDTPPSSVQDFQQLQANLYAAQITLRQALLTWQRMINVAG
jgi:hypothetical protein